MPLYEFHCPECGVFSEIRTVKARNMPAACPACGKPGKRIMSVVSGRFPGASTWREFVPDLRED